MQTVKALKGRTFGVYSLATHERIGDFRKDKRVALECASLADHLAFVQEWQWVGVKQSDGSMMGVWSKGRVYSTL
jgi:hypothetical protein